MATVTELLDFATSVPGLETGKRTDLLKWMNDGYQIAAQRTGCAGGILSLALDAGEDEYDLTSTDLLDFSELYVNNTSGDGQTTLDFVPVKEILRLRGVTTDSGDAVPYCFSTVGLNLMLFYPAPSAATTVNGIYTKMPKTLHEATNDATYETTPSAIPKPFHYEILANYAIAKAFEFERSGDSGSYRSLFENNLELLRQHVERFPGDSGMTRETTTY